MPYLIQNNIYIFLSPVDKIIGPEKCVKQLKIEGFSSFLNSSSSIKKEDNSAKTFWKELTIVFFTKIRWDFSFKPFIVFWADVPNS